MRQQRVLYVTDALNSSLGHSWSWCAPHVTKSSTHACTPTPEPYNPTPTGVPAMAGMSPSAQAFTSTAHAAPHSRQVQHIQNRPAHMSTRPGLLAHMQQGYTPMAHGPSMLCVRQAWREVDTWPAPRAAALTQSNYRVKQGDGRQASFVMTADSWACRCSMCLQQVSYRPAGLLGVVAVCTAAALELLLWKIPHLSCCSHLVCSSV